MTVAQGFAHKKHVIIANSLKQLVQGTYRAETIVSDNLQDEVNKWVAEKTRGQIPTLLDDNETDCALLNAIYLAFKWKNEFEQPERGWAVEEFTCADGAKHPVSMMAQEEYFSLHCADTFKVLEMPYLSPTGRKLSQVIFLPNDPTKLDELEANFSADFIEDCRKKAGYQKVDVKMPKTKSEWELDLLEILKEMGLPLDAFDQDIIKDGRIDAIIHKTFVSNDEKGTEAAAVSAVNMICESCFPDTREPETFHLKHAYAYLIMDGDTMLFRGRISDKEPLINER